MLAAFAGAVAVIAAVVLLVVIFAFCTGMFPGVLQIAFAAMLACNMLCAVFWIKLISLLPLPKATREGIGLLIIQFAWTLTLWFSPWVQIIQAESDDWKDIVAGTEAKISVEPIGDQCCDASYVGDITRPLFVLGNHTSFFDTIFSVTRFPTSVMWHLRTYMNNSLFKLPVLGTICRCVGHFSVHFKSAEEGKFKLDEEKMKITDQKVDRHLSNHGWLCFFPEGQLNKNPDQLLPLRYGGFKKALDFDAKLMAFIAVGNAEVWPVKAAVGGFPGKVVYSAKVLTPNGCRAFAAELRKQAKEKNPQEEPLEDQKLLANELQQVLQKEYDKLKQIQGGSSSKKQD